jgi:hypothetical protein
VKSRRDSSRPPLKLSGRTYQPCRAAKDTDWTIRGHQQFLTRVYFLEIDNCSAYTAALHICIQEREKTRYVVVFSTSIADPLEEYNVFPGFFSQWV